MSTKYLSELRGEVQRDSTTFAEANRLGAPRIDVASASNITLNSTQGNLNITGNASITGFTVKAGNTYFVRFDGAVTLVNSPALVTQTGGDIAAEAGATCILVATQENVVEIYGYSGATFGRFAGAYDVLLPLGTYSSGSYSIPSGRVWDDYDIVIGIGSTSSLDADGGRALFVTKEMMALVPDAWSYRGGTASNVFILNASSSTQMTIAVIGSAKIKTVIAYRKPGVA